MRTVMTPPAVSNPRDKGVTFSSSNSWTSLLLSQLRMAAWSAAPYATASSGLILLLSSFLRKKLYNSYRKKDTEPMKEARHPSLRVPVKCNSWYQHCYKVFLLPKTEDPRPTSFPVSLLSLQETGKEETLGTRLIPDLKSADLLSPDPTVIVQPDPWAIKRCSGLSMVCSGRSPTCDSPDMIPCLVTSTWYISEGQMSEWI